MLRVRAEEFGKIQEMRCQPTGSYVHRTITCRRWHEMLAVHHDSGLSASGRRIGQKTCLQDLGC